MPPVTLPGAWRIVMQFPRDDGDLVQNVFHVNGAVATQAELQILADGLAAQWDAGGWAANLRTGMGPPTFLVYDLNPGNPIAADATAVNIGGSGGRGTPSEIAAVITLRTGLRGRSFRGRTYIGPLSEGMIGPQGQIAQDAPNGQNLLTAFDNFWTGVQAIDTGSGDHTIMVASFTLQRITPVIRFELDDQVDHQQSRAIQGDAVISEDFTPNNPGT